MVPFPYSEASEGKKHDAYMAAGKLALHPDGKGLPLPPIKKKQILESEQYGRKSMLLQRKIVLQECPTACHMASSDTILRRGCS
jgi:hypothetical protein